MPDTDSEIVRTTLDEFVEEHGPAPMPSLRARSEARPRVGCAAIITLGQKVLLGQRGKEPMYGRWVLPGGGVDFLESLDQTLKREIKEETGLDVEVGENVGVYEHLTPPSEHRVIIYKKATPVEGELTPSSDLLEARFVDKEDLRRMKSEDELTPLVARVLKDVGWIEDDVG